MAADQLTILCIDDNKDIIQTLVIMLTREGYLVYSASDPRIGIAIAKKLNPDLILLDIMMPAMSGYEVCKVFKQDARTSTIPVVFLSALNQPQNKVSALAAGGVDYLTKPFDKESLLEITKRYAGKKTAWGAYIPSQGVRSFPAAAGKGHYTFTDFKLSIIDRFKLDGAGAKAVAALQLGDIYKLAEILGITSARVARLIADFSKLPYFPVINPEDIKPGVLPVKFAMQNNIAALAAPGASTLLAISHPFDLELHELIRGIMGAEFEFGITEPSNISALYTLASPAGADIQKIPGDEGMVIEEAALNRLRAAAKGVQNEINASHLKYLTGRLLQFLAEEMTAEARIEVQGDCYLVRAGAPDALEEFTRFTLITGAMVIARLKALGGMDILERSKPQKGAFSIICRSGNCRLTLSTETADYGESLILTPEAAYYGESIALTPAA
ncbi:MAG: response regulator [Elusimicrobia bacterium]|nr:response regulator [Elusimicrobiota bacterium]